MTRARMTRFAAAAMTTASAVLLAAAPAHPVTVAPAPPAADAGRSVGELLAALERLYRKAESASAAHRRAARELRHQRQKTDELEARLAGVRVRLSAERKEAARIARAQYRTGAPGLPPAVGVLLADDPVIALHHGHALRRAAARQQATVRALAGGERRRGAVAARAREALRRQQDLAGRTQHERRAARHALREVERLLTSLTPAQLAALQRYKVAGAPGGTISPP